ncbi:MAG: TolC family protein [Verrucomicrobia bacterium]|nr:TolC family protein [Verrucomicrobiota bacterium]
MSFDHRTGSITSTPFDQYGANVGFTRLTQPLLRDFWIDSQRHAIQIARLNRGISDLEFERQVSVVLNNVQRFYYDLIAAEENMKSAYSAYGAARQLAEDTRREVEIGSKAPLADKEAESTAQLRLADYYSAMHRRNTAENQLKALTGRKFRDQYDARLVPDEKLFRIERRPVDLQESWKSGLERRPDYRAYFLRTDQERINVRFARNQIYPNLDVEGGYSRGGVDTTVTGINQGSLGGAFHDIRRNSQPSHGYGVTLSTPLTLRRERYALKRAKSQQEQALLELESVEQSILVEIDTTISLIRSSNMRIQATRAAREAAEQSVDAETKRLARGVSTPTQVLQLQDRLIRAQSDEVNALLDYNKALSDLDLQDGSILERNKVQIQPLR